MLDVARKNSILMSEVTFQNADATELPFKDEMFDAIVCQFGVMFFDKAAAFRETYRTLRHGDATCLMSGIRNIIIHLPV